MPFTTLVLIRLEIVFVANKLCQFLHTIIDAHWTTVKRVLWYLKGSCSHGLQLEKFDVLSLIGFSDSNWTNCIH